MLQSDNPFFFSQNDFIVVFILMLGLTSFMLYWFGTHSRIFKKICQSLFPNSIYNYSEIIASRFAGFIILGILPLSFCLILKLGSLPSFGIISQNSDKLMQSVCWIIGLGLVAIFINWINSGNSENLSKYPQIRMPEWRLKQLFMNSLSWVIYLIGYEILFRGILLLPLIPILGVWPAIVVNITIYSLAHFPKGLSESIGSILMGSVLCILTIITGTVYVAIGVHASLALSNFLFSWNKNPDMKYINLKKRK